MLNSTEVREAVENLFAQYGYPRTTESFRERILVVAALESQWQAWLAQEYASDLPEVAQNAIFKMAFEDAHSDGYESVESRYKDLVSFARTVRSE